MNEESSSPNSWLWLEIARRFGQDAADDLHTAYMDQMREYSRHQRQKHDLRDLLRLEERRRQRADKGQSTKQIDRSIAIRQKRLEEAEKQRDRR